MVWYFLLLFKSVFEFGVGTSDPAFLGSSECQFTSPVVCYCNPVTKKLVSLHLTSSYLLWFIHNFINLFYYWVLYAASCFGSILNEKKRHPSICGELRYGDVICSVTWLQSSLQPYYCCFFVWCSPQFKIMVESTFWINLWKPFSKHLMLLPSMYLSLNVSICDNMSLNWLIWMSVLQYITKYELFHLKDSYMWFEGNR